MKKIKSFIRLLSLTLFGLIGFSIISCENTTDIPSIESSSPTSEPIHTHEWDEGEVTKEATCIEEGQITYSCTSCDEVKFETIAALGHNEVIDEAKEATCTETGLTEGKHCDRCNEVLVQQEEISSLGHSFADWTIVKEATCENQGTKRRDCNNCDHYEEETIEAKEHNYESEVTKPTCVEQGYETFTCTNCNHSYIDNYVDALGHREVVDTGKEATCTTSGLTEGKHCDRCNEVLVQQEEIPALGHNYGTLINEIPATCTKTGIIAHYHCDRCDKYFDTNKKEVVELTISLKEHEFDNSSWTCDATGHWHKCKYCNEKDSFSAHTPNMDSATEYDDKVCTICDYVIQEALGHTHVMQYTEKVEATCETSGNIAYYQCKGCKKYYSDVNGNNEITDISSLVISALGHNYGKLVEKVEATCEEEGTKAHYHCDRCDKNFNNNKAEINDLTIPALGHKEVTDKAVEPTCTETGLTQGSHCSTCNKVLVKQEVIPALGHNEVIDASKEATCTTSGLTEGSHCDRCKEILVAQEVIPALGHNEVIDTKVDATCENTGLTEGKHCGRCNEVLVAQKVIPAKGHTEVTDKAVNATCTETGLTQGSHCSTCNKVLVKQEVIPALGHNEVIDASKKATCTETGLTQGSHCSKCNETLVEQIVVEALGHDYESVVTEPTCEEQGYTIHTCSRCNDSYVDSYTKAIGHDFDIAYYWEEPNSTNGFVSIVFTCKNNPEHVAYDADCNSEVTSEVIIEETCEEEGLIRYTVSGFYYKPFSATYDKVTSALGHVEVIDSAVAPTCESTGLTEGSHCDRCKEVLVAQEEIAALGHDYESVVTDPTCVDKGYTTHTCNRCDDTYVDSYVEELGHNYGDWVVTNEPGCESVGTKRRDCYECDYYEEEEIAALGHNEVIDKTVEPTCTETGLTEGSHCDRCKEVLVAQEVVAALGHDYESVVTNPTCEEQGYTTHTCSRCDDSYIDSYTKS